MEYNNSKFIKNMVIERANINDIEEIIELKKKIHDNMQNKEWYVIDGTNEEYLKRLLENEGLILKVVHESRIIAFLIVQRHLKMTSELVRIMELENIISSCIEYDNVAVLNEYRGNGIFKKLMEEAEKIFKLKEIKNIFVTVHPDNKASLNSCLACGFEICKTTTMYGGKKRYILKKSIN